MNFTCISVYTTLQIIRMVWKLVRTHTKVDTEVQKNWYIPQIRICLIEKNIENIIDILPIEEKLCISTV